MSNRGATIILLDNIHFNGVSVFSHLTFQFGCTGFPWNNGGFTFVKNSLGKEHSKIRKTLHYTKLPGCWPYPGSATQDAACLETQIFTLKYFLNLVVCFHWCTLPFLCVPKSSQRLSEKARIPWNKPQFFTFSVQKHLCETTWKNQVRECGKQAAWKKGAP